MLRVGLSGGIGSGKSTVASRLRELGALVVDADALAREVVAPGEPGLAAIVERFGAGVLTGDGTLDRAALGAVVFADPAARTALEQITHPRIAARTAALVASAPPEQVVVHDVPLLVEKHLGAQYHLAVIVAADEATRIARLTTARGLAEADARARIAAQADDLQRRAAADVWLDNSGSFDAIRAQVDALWAGRLVDFNTNLLQGIPSGRPEAPAVLAYDPCWPAQAQRLAERLSLALGERAVRVEHIGSTSVPGLRGRDVVDLQVGVRRLTDADEPDFVSALAEKGFPRVLPVEADGPGPERRDPARWRGRFHEGADPGRPVDVHVRELDGPAWRDALLVRDWLRADARVRAEYAEHKAALAAACATTGEYAAARERWLVAALPRAQAWARHTGWATA